MTVTIKSEVIGDYYIYIEQDKYSPGYKVGIIRKISDEIYGYPLSERYYSSLEKAKRRYRNLKIKYKEKENKTMKKWNVHFGMRLVYDVEVEAETREEAIMKATTEWEEANLNDMFCADTDKDCWEVK